MTNVELQKLVETISLRDFGRPFKHQAVFNARLKTTGGRYHLGDHHIDINPLMLTDFDETNLTGVIRHELVHYHLALAGQPFNHRSRQFKQLLAHVHGSRFAPAPKRPQTKKSAVQYVYECEKCGRHFVRQRRVNVNKFACGVCGGHLHLQESSKLI